MDKELEFFRKCLLAMGINTSLESESGDKPLFDYGIRNSLGRSISLTSFLDLHEETGSGPEMIQIFDGYLLSYMMLQLPSDRVLVGPYTTMVPTTMVIDNIWRASGGNDGMEYEFRKFYACLPELKDEGILVSSCGVLMDSYYNGKWIMRHDAVQLKDVFPSGSDRMDDGFRLEKVYRAENLLIDAVINGNLKYIEDFPEKIHSMNVVMRIPDPVRNLKNYAVIMNTLLRKASEKGGASILDVDKLSSSFAHSIENCITIDKLLDVLSSMPYSYVMLVRENRFSSCSTIVTRALSIMERDMNSTLISVSEKLGVTDSWLSRCLSRDTGMGFSRLMMKYRSDHAGLMLITTDDSMEKIAADSGFSDVSYFSRVFRKMKGMTPSEWRRKSAIA